MIKNADNPFLDIHPTTLILDLATALASTEFDDQSPLLIDLTERDFMTLDSEPLIRAAYDELFADAIIALMNAFQ